MLWIGIDVGDTFTDALAYDQSTGAFTFAKAPSIPADPTRAALKILKDAGTARGCDTIVSPVIR